MCRGILPILNSSVILSFKLLLKCNFHHEVFPRKNFHLQFCLIWTCKFSDTLTYPSPDFMYTEYVAYYWISQSCVCRNLFSSSSYPTQQFPSLAGSFDVNVLLQNKKMVIMTWCVTQNDIYFKCRYGHILQKKLHTSQKSEILERDH